MIKKLRIKFVLVIMAIVMVLLGCILGVVIHFTGQSMEMQSISMMRTIATSPFQQGIRENPWTMKYGCRSLPFRSAAGGN